MKTPKIVEQIQIGDEVVRVFVEHSEDTHQDQLVMFFRSLGHSINIKGCMPNHLRNIAKIFNDLADQQQNNRGLRVALEIGEAIPTWGEPTTDYEGLCCNIPIESCPLWQECCCHVTAGEFRAEGGMEPGAYAASDGKWYCTKQER